MDIEQLYAKYANNRGALGKHCARRAVYDFIGLNQHSGKVPRARGTAI
jgi:hypothetical protein